MHGGHVPAFRRGQGSWVGMCGVGRTNSGLGFLRKGI